MDEGTSLMMPHHGTKICTNIYIYLYILSREEKKMTKEFGRRKIKKMGKRKGLSPTIWREEEFGKASLRENIEKLSHTSKENICLFINFDMSLLELKKKTKKKHLNRNWQNFNN